MVNSMKLKNQTRSRVKDILLTLVFCVLVVIGLIVTLKVVNILISPTPANQETFVEKTGCFRTTPYPIPPEFSRAISIIKQRTDDPAFLEGYENCLNIQYADLKEKGQGAEGVFIFDSSVSSQNDLRLYVDSSYKGYDDYSTAILLVHEITHASQFYHSNTKSCVDKEVQAYYNEIVLYTKLNAEERESISARMYNQTKEPSDPIQGISNLLDLLLSTGSRCNNNVQCMLGQFKVELQKMVTESPFYQKQCKL